MPLYALWSVGLLILFRFAPVWDYAGKFKWYTRLLFGQTDYQLYFVPLIIMLYFIFAVVFPLPKIIKAGLTLGVIAVTYWWYGYLPQFLGNIHTTLFQPDQLQYLIPLTWLWYAWFGMIAVDFRLDEKLNSYWLKRLFLGLSLGSAVWLILYAYQAIHQQVDVLLALQFTRWPVVIYATSCLFLVLSLSRSKDDPRDSSLAKQILAAIGTQSFLIFLAHTLFIRLTLAQWRYPVAMNTWWLGVGTELALLAGSWVIIKKKL